MQLGKLIFSRAFQSFQIPSPQNDITSLLKLRPEIEILEKLTYSIYYELESFGFFSVMNDVFCNMNR